MTYAQNNECLERYAKLITFDMNKRDVYDKLNTYILLEKVFDKFSDISCDFIIFEIKQKLYSISIQENYKDMI